MKYSICINCATKDETDYFLIDTTAKDDKYKYRRNLQPIDIKTTKKQK